jgi:WD40 repeat protein
MGRHWTILRKIYAPEIPLTYLSNSTFRGVAQGFTDIVYFKEKSIVIGSTTRSMIHVFNIINGMMMATLSGHINPVIRMYVDEPRHVLLSVSIDKVLKVWDLRTYLMIHTVTDYDTYQPQNRYTAACFYPRKMAFVLFLFSLFLLN